MTDKTELPPLFISRMNEMLGQSADSFFKALSEPSPVSVRLNRRKPMQEPLFADAERVEWCKNGLYLPERPVFTLMPEIHAGGFYVQEAASMAYETVVDELVKRIGHGGVPIRLLDSCAAPGGKTTAAINALPDDALVVANEFDYRRASILEENLLKWGFPNIVVTRGDTAFFSDFEEEFDIVIVDAPCSGEGMMRKEEVAVSQWSEGLIAKCAELQREILANIIQAVKPGGYLIYSTCTYNREENEEQVTWLAEEYGFERVAVPALEGCDNILKSEGCYRFMPHLSRSEGLFLAVLQKPGEATTSRPRRKSEKKGGKELPVPQAANDMLSESDRYAFFMEGNTVYAYPKAHGEIYSRMRGARNLLLPGLEVATVKGKDLIPSHQLALSIASSPDAFPTVDVDVETTMAYLRKEAITLPVGAPKGFVAIRHNGLTLGLVKNLGNRCNNLYPAPYRVLMQKS